MGSADRVSIVTDEVSADLEVVRAFLDAHAVRAVELRVVGAGRVPCLSAADRGTLRAWARAGDPAIVGLSPGLFKCDVADRETARRHLREVLPRSLDLARELGAEFLVAFGFEDLEGRGPGPEHLEALALAAGASAEAGLPLLLENEPGFLACRGEEAAALISAAGHGNLFANWDPANAGDLSREALAAGLRALFPRVRHVHVKNGRVRPGERFPEYGPLAAGDIDWPAHLALLADLGYGGRFGVETHYGTGPGASASVVAELRAMLARPRGGEGAA